MSKSKSKQLSPGVQARIEAGQKTLTRLLSLIPKRARIHVRGHIFWETNFVEEVREKRLAKIVGPDENADVCLTHNYIPSNKPKAKSIICFHDVVNGIYPKHLKARLKQRFDRKAHRVEWFGRDMMLGIAGKLAQKRFGTLALAMPVKNEDETLEVVLGSFMAVCDQMVIGVDDKSSDKTLDIAHRFTDDVFMYTWQDSFCKARNLCKERCTTDWIFHCEGHEMLDINSWPHLLELEKVTVADARDGTPMPGSDPDVLFICRNLAATSEMMHPFIHRNLKEIHYERDIHNALIWNRKTSKSALAPCIRTYHRRSEEKELVRKRQRAELNEKNMKFQLLKNLLKRVHGFLHFKKVRKDWRSLYFLANQYFSEGRYELALKHYKKYMRTCPKGQNIESYQVALFASKCLMNDKRFEDVLELLQDVAHRDWGRNEHWLGMSEACYELGQYHRSYHFAEIAATYPRPYGSYTIDPMCYCALPWFFMMKACISQGQQVQAQNLFKEYIKKFESGMFRVDKEQTHLAFRFMLGINKQYKETFDAQLFLIADQNKNHEEVLAECH